MQPTQPMSQFNPGGQAGYGPPAMGGPPGGYAAPPAPQQSSSWWKWALGGCGCLLLLIGCTVGGFALMGGGMFAALSGMAGTEVASSVVTPESASTLQYTQTGTQTYSGWLEYDCAFGQGFRINGQVDVAIDGQPSQQQVLELSSSQATVTPGGGMSMRMNDVHTDINGSGNARAKVSLFDVPAQHDGQAVALTATLHLAPGMTCSTLRLIAMKR